MTDRLTSTLHERADGVQFDVPDVDALVGAGERRLRRRRTAVTGAAALAVVAAIGVAGVLRPDGGGGEPVPAPAPDQVDTYPVQQRDLPPMVVVGGDVAWVDGRTERLRAPADDLVRTSIGWVYTSYDGVFSRTESGTQRLPGVTGDLVVSDEDGVLVALYDLEPDGAVIRVLDQRTGEVRTVLEDLPRESGVVALDGDRLYGYDRGGPWVIDLGTGQRGTAPYGVSAVERATVVRNPDVTEGDPYEDTTVVETPDGQVRGLGWSGDVGALSPDGAWYASDDLIDPDDVLRGYDVAGAVAVTTGEQVRLRTGAEPGDLVMVNGWLDDTTLQVGVVPEDESTPTRLITCSVPSGACTVVLDDVLSVVPGAQFRLFVGPAS